VSLLAHVVVVGEDRIVMALIMRLADEGRTRCFVDDIVVLS